MVNQNYLSQLQLNKANTSDTKGTFFELHLSISYGLVLLKFMINVMTSTFPLFGWRRSELSLLWSVYRFARVSSHVDDFNTRYKCLTSKLLKQGYRYHKLRKAFCNFYCRHHELVSNFNAYRN